MRMRGSSQTPSRSGKRRASNSCPWRHSAPATISAAPMISTPRSGTQTVFRGAFAMHDACAACHLRFEREPGYFIGAIYINYAATAMLSIGGFFLLDAYTGISLTAQLLLWSAFGIGFPLFFYR